MGLISNQTVPIHSHHLHKISSIYNGLYVFQNAFLLNEYRGNDNNGNTRHPSILHSYLAEQ